MSKSYPGLRYSRSSLPDFPEGANDNVKLPTPYSPVRTGPFQLPTPANDNVTRNRRVLTAGFKNAKRIIPLVRYLDLVTTLNQSLSVTTWQNGKRVHAPGYQITRDCGGSDEFISDLIGGSYQCGLPTVVYPGDLQIATPPPYRPNIFQSFDKQGEPVLGGHYHQGVRLYEWTFPPDHIDPWNTPYPLPSIVPNNQPLYTPVPSNRPSRRLDPLPRPGHVSIPMPLPYTAIPLRIQNPLLVEQGARGNTRPNQQPGKSKPGQQPGSGPADRPKPPGKRTKEHKYKVAATGGMLGGLVGKGRTVAYTITELLDALEAVEKALPAKYRAPKGSTPQKRAMAIYRNSEHIDPTKLVLNLVANHITDEIVGRANAGANNFLTKQGVRRGRAF